MSIRKIQNITIYAELDENIQLPTELPVIEDGVNVGYLPVASWFPSTTDTSKPADLIHVGRVAGYPHDILCSVIVSGIDEDPPSVFPDEIDDFGNRKVDIQTADIPDIDDFQYFKAKHPRSTVEGYQLMQLRELLADKVILARDINHLRNAVIEIEKFLKKLADKVDELEARIEVLEEETVIGGKNLGSGEGVYKDVVDRIMNFKSIQGEGGITITSTDDEIQIGAPPPPVIPPPTAGCDVDVLGKSFEVCNASFPMRITDGSFNLTDSGSFSLKMVRLKPRENEQVDSSLMISLGEGQESGKGAGRILKHQSGFIFEVKDRVGYGTPGYSGVEISYGNTPDFYTGDPTSRVWSNLELGTDGPNPYDMSSSIYN